MANLIISADKCTGCGLCVKSCGSGALSLVGDAPRDVSSRAAKNASGAAPNRPRSRKTAAVTGDCTLCGVCVDNCPFRAISIKRVSETTPTASSEGDPGNVLVFAEQNEGELLPAAIELTGAGRTIADAKGSRLIGILCGGPGISEKAQLLIGAGADDVYLCEDPRLSHRTEEEYTAAIHQVILQTRPEIALFSATAFGCSVAPWLAARLKTGLTADCTELVFDPETGLLNQTRPAFGGNLMATIICPAARPQMATVRPGVMRAPNLDLGRTGSVVRFTIPPRETVPRIALLESVKKETSGGLENARIIVSAGRGIGKQKNLELVQELADLLGASFGVSRPLIDAGWCAYEHQIGQTGRSVTPKLLIAFGISGAVQHLAGIGGAEKVLAVNSDPDAPIFPVADYGVVGDAVEVIKAMIEELRKAEEP